MPRPGWYVIHRQSRTIRPHNHHHSHTKRTNVSGIWCVLFLLHFCLPVCQWFIGRPILIAGKKRQWKWNDGEATQRWRFYRRWIAVFVLVVVCGCVSVCALNVKLAFRWFFCNLILSIIFAGVLVVDVVFSRFQITKIVFCSHRFAYIIFCFLFFCRS